MITSDKDIYLQETETKPNHYACYVLCFTLAVISICWFLNERDIFHVGKADMRIGAIITIFVLLVPLVHVLAIKNILSHSGLKYVIITSVSVFTFTVSIMLTFHTTILLLFPILFAMLYRSKMLGIVATAASFLCTVISPVIAYMLGTWDIPLFQELIAIGTNGGVVSVVGGGNGITLLNIGKILLYLAFPRLLLVGSCAMLLFNNIRLGVDHVNNQILLNRISHLDALTGLYNQNCYQEFLQAEKARCIGIAVLFFDVNGLKQINDTQGHECGDRLLQRCALSLLNVCDNESSAAFRIGGDEFIIVMEHATEDSVKRKISQWKNALAAINRENELIYDGMVCSLALGYKLGSSNEIEELVRCADAYMYQNKAQEK